MSEALKGGILSHIKPEVVEYISSVDQDERILGELFDINMAHIIMLTEEGILSRELGAKILRALSELKETIALDRGKEDAYVCIEDEVSKIAGEGIGGNLNIAKSRNDQIATALRMRLRRELLDLIALGTGFLDGLLKLAEGGLHSLFPGYTHLRIAQPITLAHYAIAQFDAIARDLERLMGAYGRVNKCPMGAAALATTSFPINRDRISELLGFDGLVENSLDAVGDRDFALEALADLSIMAWHIIRILEDLILYSSPEFSILELPTGFCSTSSIMPQKRNPDALEVMRARLSGILGDLAAAFSILKALPSGYNLDFQELTPRLWNGIDELKRAIPLLSELIPKVRVAEGVEGRLMRHFATASELANFLCSKYGIPFRSAYRIVGEICGLLFERGEGMSGISPELVKEVAKRKSGVELDLEAGELKRAVDPKNFVESHKAIGGPSPDRVGESIERRRVALEEISRFVERKREGLSRSKQLLEAEVKSIAGT
ncbi:MAG: argininosuccinate lyase [Candidatus Bathyarchaeia archaeon]